MRYDHIKYEKCMKIRGLSKRDIEKLWKEKLRLAELFRSLRIVSEKALEAYLKVPRECFVRPEYIKYAYIDEPLPLAKDATISAISMSLLFLDYAELKEGDKVLEIGTGSGYQAALIAEAVYPKNPDGTLKRLEEKLVYSMEISEELYKFALENLRMLGYDKYIEVRLGDGTLGWPEENIKFDAIIVTAAGERIPPPLLKQLKVGGRLVMPKGSGFWQTLIRVRKLSEEPLDYVVEHLEEVRFVPLKGKYGINGEGIEK